MSNALRKIRRAAQKKLTSHYEVTRANIRRKKKAEERRAQRRKK